MSRNNDYTTGNFENYLHHQNYSKLIGIDLSRLLNTSTPQQIIDLTGISEEDDSAAMFSIHEKQQKTILNFCLY